MSCGTYGRIEGKRPLGRPTCRREDRIKIELKAVGWRGMGWNDLAQDRDMGWTLVKVEINLWVL
jgi:hypothetical protein